jgi:pilus assembly protein CpaD
MPKSMTNRLPRHLIRPLVIAAVAAAGFAAPTMARDPAYRGMEPVKQPVVQRTDFVFDATPDNFSGLSRPEKERILDWFDAIGLGYGDHVSIAGGALYSSPRVTDAIAGLVGRYGLILAPEAPATAGYAPSGAVRIVVSRSTASVPGCPDWNDRSEADFEGGLSYNFGCATNGNLAAMVANPEDLVLGRSTRSDLRAATSDRAIKTYRNAAPTGAGGLK